MILFQIFPRDGNGMEQRVIRALLKPAAYPETTGSVELVQTHISYIFLTDTHAYKVKKPVDFGFLNFTTLDRRRFYCDEEIRLNRRLAPDMYLDVVEIRETDDGAAFFGSGRVIDYAVKMKRLPAGRMLDQLLDQGGVSAQDVRNIAGTVARFHQHAERSAEINAGGTLAAIRFNWEENFQQTEEFQDITLRRQDFRCIRDWVIGFTELHAPLFEQRIADGFIRDGDGDLHTENICLGETGEIWIFDCIEFNPRFRYGDTAADIAFLLMDFDYHGRPKLGTVFLDTYIAATGDTSITQLLDFYKIYRAFIRGKVESLRFKDGQLDEEARQRAQLNAMHHFRLCRGYIARRQLPLSLILTCGLTGTGKSSVARRLAFELGLEIISSDVLRKKLVGIAPSTPCPAGYNEGIYGREITGRTYDELLLTAEEALTAGQSVIVDATMWQRAVRHRFSDLAYRHGTALRILHIQCPEELVRKRLEARIADPDEPSDGRWEIYLRQREDFEPPTADEGDIIAIDTSATADENIDAVLTAMGIASCGRD